MKRLSKRETGQQNRLHEQLDFFGARKKRFISIYASKPRIRIKQNPMQKPEIGKVTEIDYNKSRHEYLEKLFLSQQRAGLAQQQMSAIGLAASGTASQIASVRQQQAMNSAMQMQGMTGSAFGMGMGSQFGWSDPRLFCNNL